MAFIRFPDRQKNDWGGINPKNKGLIYRSFNIDFDHLSGNPTLSRATRVFTDTNTGGMANLKIPSHFIYTDAGNDTLSNNARLWWMLSKNDNSDTTTALLYKTPTTNPASSAWNQDAQTGTPTDARDMAIFGFDSNAIATVGADSNADHQLIVTRDTAVALLNDTATNVWNATWGNGLSPSIILKNGIPHPVDVFYNTAVIGDANRIHTIEKIIPADTGNYTFVSTRARLNFPGEYSAYHIFHTVDKVWFCLQNRTSDAGGGFSTSVGNWDGAGPDFNLFPVSGIIVLSGVNWNDIPFVLTDKGIIYRWNGNGFEEDIHFPCLEEGIKLIDQNGTFSVHPRGMTVEDDLIHINLGTVETDSDVASERVNAGIWVYNPRNKKLFNKYSLSNDINLALNNSGQQRIREPGAIINTNEVNTKFLIGARVFNNYGPTPTTLSIIAGLQAQTAFISGVNNSYSRGFFETQPINSPAITGKWSGIWTKYRRLRNFADTNYDAKIIIKSKGDGYLKRGNAVGNFPYERRGTWMTTSRLLIAPVDTSPGMGCPAINDEIEVLTGRRSGVTAHITAVADTNNNTVVNACSDTTNKFLTIDDTLIAPIDTSDASLIRIDRWRKLDTSSDTTSAFVYFADGTQSPTIQYKVEMRGVPEDVELKELAVYFDTGATIER